MLRIPSYIPTAGQREFLEAISENPDDNAPRLIYADYLEEQHEGGALGPSAVAHASLIRAQIALSDSLITDTICLLHTTDSESKIWIPELLIDDSVSRVLGPSVAGELQNCAYWVRSLTQTSLFAKKSCSGLIAIVTDKPELTKQFMSAILPMSVTRGFVAEVGTSFAAWMSVGQIVLKSNPVIGVLISLPSPDDLPIRIWQYEDVITEEFGTMVSSSNVQFNGFVARDVRLPGIRPRNAARDPTLCLSAFLESNVGPAAYQFDMDDRLDDIETVLIQTIGQHRNIMPPNRDIEPFMEMR